jgi:rhodanese-related sulfurtransferase
LADLHIDVEELHTALQAGEDVQLLDVREGWEYTLARLDGAVWIPLAELDRRLGELDRERPLVVYCHHGIRSLHATLALRSRGFETARSLRGGLDRWAQEIDPSTPRY